MSTTSCCPPGWVATTLGQLVGRLQYGYTASASYECTGPRFLRITDISDHGVNWGTVPGCEVTTGDLEKYRLHDGDLVFARSGSIEKAWLVQSPPDAVFASYLIRGTPLIPEFGVWLGRFVRSRGYLKQIGAAGAGIAMQNVNAQKLSAVAVPLAPLNEQRRIVAKIEELTDRSRRAREALDTVPTLLDRFRQSVLAAAFRGDLTAEWRAKNPDVEPASELLERIRQERRLKWEEDLLTKGKDPTKGKYLEPEKPDTTSLPPLPDGWCWASVSELSTKVVDGVHKKPEYVAEGIPFVTIKNLTRGPGISFENLNYISPEDHAEYFKRANPEKGDILISKDGTLGVTRLIETDAVFSIFVSVALIKPVIPNISRYFSQALQSPQVQDQMVPVGSGLQHIHLTDLRKDCIPLAPLEEQVEVLTQISRLLPSGDSAAEFLATAKRHLDRLDQSILAKAFRGELVPQDPSDEPASALLARIRDDQAEAVVPKARRGQKPRELVETRE